jgi:hypothetical protein
MVSKKRKSSDRVALTNTELACLTADEFAKLRLTDDEKARLRLINRERNERRTEQADARRKEEIPLVADLRKIGLPVRSVWDLVGMARPYPEAVPILLDHLTKPYSDRIAEGIARALAVPDARNAWQLLVSEYVKAPWERNGVRVGAKDGLAVALAATVTNDTMSELIVLAKDRSHGPSRLLLLRSLRKSNSPAVLRAIEELRNDPDLSKEIAAWTRRSRGI